MSSSYVYTPPSQPTPYLEPYYNVQQNSPFIPDANLYPRSPFTPVTSLPGTPRMGGVPIPTPGTPRRVRFPDDYGVDYNAAGWEIPQRRRRPSWHAGMACSASPTASGHWLQTPAAGYNPRRHSFGNTNAPYQQPWSPYHDGASPWSGSNAYLPPQPPLIHPFLNGESPRADFHFDLSLPTFSPMRLMGQGQAALLSPEEYEQPATHPPITRLRIVCDLIPLWPIDLEYHAYLGSPNGMGAPPITLADVLVAIHKSLHHRISHADWAKLSLAEETAVSRAYTKRCRNAASMEMLERSQGVKRVDFLLDKVLFRGLVRVGGEGFEVMKLIVG